MCKWLSCCYDDYIYTQNQELTTDQVTTLTYSTIKPKGLIYKRMNIQKESLICTHNYFLKVLMNNL